MVRRFGLDSCDSGYGPLVGCCKYSTEPWGNIRSGEFLD
jgi:hypothetical protein